MSHPVRVDGYNGPWPLHGRAASQAVEAAALPGHPSGVLMQRAGLGAARLVLARWPAARRVLVLAGPGNNGGDGWVLAQRLHACGVAVEVHAPSTIGSTPPRDAVTARSAAVAAGVAVVERPSISLENCDLVVDALLGIGSTGAPRTSVAATMRCVHEARELRPQLPLLALDHPSGLDIDTGQPWPGAEPVPATATLSLLTLKPGLFTGRGRDLAGEIWFDDLGIAAADLGVAATASLVGPPSPLAELHTMHKGNRGDVWIVGGCRGMEGAALLAADAAARGGAGRVWVSLLADDPGPTGASASGSGAVVPRWPHLLALPQSDRSDPARLATTTVVAGCGGGAAMASALPAPLAHAARLVLDADALNHIARTDTLRSALCHRGRDGLPTILTPHPLEAARLLGMDTAAVQSDRLAAAQRLADGLAACVVLKGSGTVVAAPGRSPCIVCTGNSALATGGSGDVLAGWLAAAWAQAPQAAPEAVATAAAWQHGRAADRWRLAGHGGPLPANDLAAWIAGAN